MRHISDDFQGLFALEPLAAGTILWKNRADGPAEVSYRKIYGSDLRTLSPDELRYFIRYSYQNDDDFFISPLCAEEVDRDLSNYWNHSCDPNTVPLDEDHVRGATCAALTFVQLALAVAHTQRAF
jgi:hypothetical protein